MTIRKDQTLTIKATGEKVRVLSVDSDARASVWVVYCANPDSEAMLARAELAA